MSRALAAVLALVLALAAAPAARGDDLAEAKASFRRGVELYKERRWKEAMEEFQAAYRAKPHGALHFNVAQCRERLDDWPGAIRSYHDYLREVPGAADKDAVRAEVRRLEGRLAGVGVQVLLLDSTPSGARVAIEGLDRGSTPLHVVLRPGTYAVAVSLDGHAPWSHKVEVAGPAAVAVEARLKPLAGARRAPAPDLAARPPGGPAPARLPAPPADRPRSRLPAWIAAGAAVAAGAAAVAFTASARSDERAIDALAAPDGAAAASKARSATSKRRTARVLYGVAGGAAAASATLFLLEWKF